MSQVVLHYPDFHFDYYSIIPHKTKPQILMLCDENSWFLPHFMPYEHHFGMVGHINQAIKSQLGLDVTTLRCFYQDYSLETQTGCRVYAMENRSSEWTVPTNARWVEFQELDSLSFAFPKLRQVLESWFAEIASNNIPPQRVPWAKIGWFEQATIWINLQFSNLGLSATAPIEQLKSQVRSCLLKVNTTAGKVYFKSGSGVFAGEPIFTKFLAELYPDQVLDLLAINTKQQWMLMPDFGGKLLSQVTDVSAWEKALQLLAKMQIQAVDQINELLDIGFPDRRIERIASQIESLFADTSALLVPQNSPYLDSTEIERLRSLIVDLRFMCDELTVCGIPQTLVQGDFWAQNVVLSQEKYIFFDWSDAAIAHPFFDAVFFLQYIEAELPNVTDARSRLRNAYLEPWTTYLPMEQLISIFEKAQPVAALYYAILNYEYIGNLEPAHRWEMENTIPYWLKNLLIQM